VELRHLRYFVTIAEERSFTRASERLWIAQPALSTQIKRLESELGVRLFDRHSRGVTLTREGALFFERARAALAAAADAAATGRDLADGVVGSVRVGVATEARWRRTPEVLHHFSRARPGVELTVLESYAGTLWDDLREGRLDALIAPAGHASGGLRRLELGSEPWVVLVGARHRLAGIGSVAAGELDGERIAVTGQRGGAVPDRTVAELIAALGVTAELVPGGPGPALLVAVAQGEVVSLTTAPERLPGGVMARSLVPLSTLPFELLSRDETPSPVLAELAGAVAAAAAPAPAIDLLTAAA
jgi:DNA-binding transcriptional LysR family regulator